MSNEGEVELHSAPSTMTPEQRKNKLMVSAVIILVGVLMVVISAILYAPFTAPAEMIQVASSQRIGAVVDAGDSGTTLVVYGCNTDPCEKPYANCNSTCKSVVKLKTVVCESRGVLNYTELETLQLQDQLRKCLAEGAKGYDKDSVPLAYILPVVLSRFRPGGLIGIDAVSGIRSNFSSSMYLNDEENGRDVKPVDVIKTKLNAKLYRPITEEVKFRDMTPAVPWLVILVIGVFVIVAGISYLHMVCARSKQADA